MVRKKYSKKEILLTVASIMAIILILTFYLWHQTQSIRLGYQIRDLEDKVASLKKEVNQLETQKSSLLTLKKVEKTAKEKLNLRKPQKEQIIFEDFQNRP
ncbi:cell division protein FtsL [bacterium]|nr:cell division protein FtsL [bacterium]